MEEQVAWESLSLGFAPRNIIRDLMSDEVQGQHSVRVGMSHRTQKGVDKRWVPTKKPPPSVSDWGLRMDYKHQTRNTGHAFKSGISRNCRWRREKAEGGLHQEVSGILYDKLYTAIYLPKGGGACTHLADTYPDTN